MAVKNEKDLNDQLRGYWLKAVAAIELGNFSYAIELLQNLLRREPEFLTGRQMLRRAEVTRTKSEKKAFFKISTAPLAVMKAQRELKKDPRKTIELIEKVLGTNPYNRQAISSLRRPQLAAGILRLQSLLCKPCSRMTRRTPRFCINWESCIINASKTIRRLRFIIALQSSTPSISKRSGSAKTLPRALR